MVRRLNCCLLYSLMLFFSDCDSSKRTQHVHWDSLNLSDSDRRCFFFLDTVLIDVARQNFGFENLNTEDYYIPPESKVEVRLTNSYRSIVDVCEDLDIGIVEFLAKNYGLEDVESKMNDKVFIHKKSALIEVLEKSGVYAFTLEFTGEKTVLIGLAYAIVA